MSFASALVLKLG